PARAPVRLCAPALEATRNRTTAAGQALGWLMSRLRWREALGCRRESRGSICPVWRGGNAAFPSSLPGLPDPAAPSGRLAPNIRLVKPIVPAVLLASAIAPLAFANPAVSNDACPGDPGGTRSGWAL